MIPFRFIHVVANVRSFLLMVECLCVSVPRVFFTRSSTDGHFGCVHILATVNNAALNREVYISFWISFHFLPVNIWKITESYAGSIFYLFIFRNFHTVFHSGYTKLDSSNPHQGLFVVFLMTAILTGVRWYLSWDFIFCSLMISDLDHLSMWLLELCLP